MTNDPGKQIKEAGDKAVEASSKFEDVGKKIEEMGKKAAESIPSFETLGGVYESLSQALGSAMGGLTALNEGMEKLGQSTQVAQNFTEAQLKQMGLLKTIATGTTESFTSMSVEGVNLFKSISKSVEDMISKAGTGEGSLQKLAASAKEKFGQAIDTSGFKSVGELADHLRTAGDNMVIAANNAIRLRQGFLGLSADTGNFSRVIELAGPNLENMNSIIASQATTIAKTATATGLSTKEIEGFYTQMGQIPGALESTISSTDGTQDSMNLLSGAIKLAVGTGKDYKDVMADMTTAFDNYGLTGENALKFTARISEISGNYGIKLKDVQSALTQTAQTFRGFANEGEAANRMAEGAAEILNKYVAALKSTGATGQDAVSMIQNMTSQIKGMDIATKSFLSAQTGGPGGLRGGYQIEQMLREGNIEGVFDKVKQQMEKQMGRIVTLDEAATSESAAAQMTRQITMLKQGPLGQFAKTDQDAMRILEGFKAAQTGSVVAPELKETILKDSIETGTKIQEQSYTALDAVRNSMEEIQASYLSPILTLMQQGQAARVGQVTSVEDTEAQRRMRADLKAELTESGRRAAYTTATTRQMLNREIDPTDVSGTSLYEAGLLSKRSLKTGVTTLSSVLDLGRQYGMPDKSPTQEEEMNKVKLQAERTREARRTMTASQPVQEAARQSVGAQRTATATASGRADVDQSASQYAPVELKVTAICKHCNQELESQHAQSLNTANRRKK